MSSFAITEWEFAAQFNLVGSPQKALMTWIKVLHVYFTSPFWQNLFSTAGSVPICFLFRGWKSCEIYFNPLHPLSPFFLFFLIFSVHLSTCLACQFLVFVFADSSLKTCRPVPCSAPNWFSVFMRGCRGKQETARRKSRLLINVSPQPRRWWTSHWWAAYNKALVNAKSYVGWGDVTVTGKKEG